MAPPTVFHVTHWKAGSQWVRAVLRAARPGRCFPPGMDMNDALLAPVVPGAIYTPVYRSRAGFERVVGKVDESWRIFFVVRDLRDTLVSWYFSLRYSHPTRGNEGVSAYRAALRERTEEEGLLYLARSPGMRDIAQMRREWLESGVPIFRYEDLLADEQGEFERMFDYCALNVKPARRREIVEHFSFERLTGRRPGEAEDVTQHLRRAAVGDWRRYTDKRLVECFEALGRDAGASLGSDLTECTPGERSVQKA